MRFYLYTFFLLLIGCSPKIDEGYISENKNELLDIYNGAINYKRDISDIELNERRKRLSQLGINRIEIKKRVDSNEFIQDDSLAYYIFETEGLFQPNTRIIYDFAITPRNFGNTELVGASYYRIQVSDRWYIESIGFD